MTVNHDSFPLKLASWDPTRSVSPRTSRLAPVQSRLQKWKTARSNRNSGGEGVAVHDQQGVRQIQNNKDQGEGKCKEQ